MRYRCIWLWIFIFGVTCSAAQRGDAPPPGEQFLGTWSGTWEGSGTGGFELTLEKDKDNAVGGRVSVTGEATYKATLRDIVFEGKKMTARYDFPPEPAGEVRLATTFDGNRATGTWSLREKATDKEAAAGTWTVTRK